MNLFPKYIIETDDELGNCLILSKCSFHHELVTDKNKVKGGGWFKYDSSKNMFIFFGDSHEFGQAKLEDVKKCVEEDKVFTNPHLTHSIAKNFKFKYDTGSELIELN